MTAFPIAPAAARAALQGLVPQERLDDDEARRRHSIAMWNCLTEPGDGTAWRVIAEIGPEAALRAVETGAIAGASALADGEFAKGLTRWRPRMTSALLEASLAAARRARVRLVVPGDDEWPEQIDDLGVHAPLCLWVRGDPRILGRLRPAAALVGARAATGYGEHMVTELSAELAADGIAIVSGAAYGIDGMAHRAALAAGGTTIALLAGGVERPYPSGHADLIDQIATTCAVVSEVPCGSTPTKWRFLQRNRTIAALSDATVVVEAGWRSGSLNTAGHAAALARPLGAVPGPVTSAASAGCHRLMREFDAHCITGADDVRELLGLGTSQRPGAAHAGRPWTDDTARVRDALSLRSWRDADDIARRCGMSRSDVEALLGLLHLDAEVERSAQGWRRVSSPSA